MSTLQGARLKGASVVSGTVSAFTEVTAGHITVNTIVFPVVPAVASVTLRVDQLVAMFNDHSALTGVRAVRTTSSTFTLYASVPIVIALGATGTVARCGLSAATTAATLVLLLDANRVAFGTNAEGSDNDIVSLGGMTFTVKQAKAMGLADTLAGADVELEGAATPTRTDA